MDKGKDYDVVYVLKFRDPMFTGSDYEYYKSMKSQNGYALKFKNSGAIVYTAQLAFILMSDDIRAFERNKQVEENFNGQMFIDSFLQGFEAGENYFKVEYKPSVDIMYGPNAESFIRELHNKYRHTGKNKEILIGWDTVIHNYPLVLTQHTIKQEGYYSGIVSGVHHLRDKHENIFNKYEFDKCWEKDDSDEIQSKQSDIQLLQSIWKNDAPMTVRNFLEMGIDLKYWDKNFQLIDVKRGSGFGSGKIFLASLSIALVEGKCIDEKIGYKLRGEVMCKVFNLAVRDTTENPYKQFQRANKRYIRGLKSLFRLS